MWNNRYRYVCLQMTRPWSCGTEWNITWVVICKKKKKRKMVWRGRADISEYILFGVKPTQLRSKTENAPTSLHPFCNIWIRVFNFLVGWTGVYELVPGVSIVQVSPEPSHFRRKFEISVFLGHNLKVKRKRSVKGKPTTRFIRSDHLSFWVMHHTLSVNVWDLTVIWPSPVARWLCIGTSWAWETW